MEESKNFVKDLLLQKEVVDPDKFMYNYIYEDIEWFAYKLSDDTIRYISYELTPHGIGYAFCATFICSRLKYDMTFVFYSKSFTNDTKGEWTDISDHFKDKLVSETMEYLGVWGK